MTRGEVEFEFGHPFTYEWRMVNEKDPKRPNVSILRIMAFSNGGMRYQQDFTEKFLAEDPRAPDVLRNALDVMRVWVKDHDAMAAQAAKLEA